MFSLISIQAASLVSTSSTAAIKKQYEPYNYLLEEFPTLDVVKKDFNSSSSCFDLYQGFEKSKEFLPSWQSSNIIKDNFHN